MRVVVGSHNPAKIEAVHTAFEKMGLEANITGVDVETGVSAQPFTDEETIEGAIHRAENSLNAQDGEVVDFGIGLEGGVVETPYGLFVCNWGAVVSKDGVVGIGGGHRVQLPDTIAQELRDEENSVRLWTDGPAGTTSKEGGGNRCVDQSSHYARYHVSRCGHLCLRPVFKSAVLRRNVSRSSGITAIEPKR